MEILDNLASGFGLALSWQNLLWCLAGVTLGTIVGVLPGLGPMAAISMLLPMTYGIGDPVTSIIFLAGIYYGTQYGGSTTSILLKLPGEAASVVTTLDGYAMTQRGRSGAALAIAAMASFFAGTVATILIMLLAKPLSSVVLMFGPVEYTSLMLLGILASVAFTNDSYIKGIAAAVLGMLLGIIGMDINSGVERFTLGTPHLYDGITFGVMAMGIFGIGEVLYNLFHASKKTPDIPSLSSLYPNREEIRRSGWPTIRGTTIGSLLGLLPGGGILISSFASYAVEEKLSKDPASFGSGNPAGVAAPEAANNASAQTSFVPMLALGLPITPVMALIMASLLISGLQPGPGFVEKNGGLFWALIASMWIGNFFLLLLNLPLVGLWVSILRINWRLLYPMIIMICAAGAYSINNSWFDVMLLILFSGLGYVFKLLKFEVTPLAMGFVIGDLFEEQMRRALHIYRGDWMIFLERPISLAFISLAMVLLIAAPMMKFRTGKKSL